MKFSERASCGHAVCGSNVSRGGRAEIHQTLQLIYLYLTVLKVDKKEFQIM